MLIVAGHIRMDPSKREEAEAAARVVMAATRAEPGCISYAFSADLEDPGVIHVFEEWKSQADLDAHFQTPHMATFQGQMGGFGIQELKLSKYEIASSQPMGA